MDQIVELKDFGNLKLSTRSLGVSTGLRLRVDQLLEEVVSNSKNSGSTALTFTKAGLGGAIQAVRKFLGFTQQAMAEGTGLTANFISLLEHGHRGCHLDTLEKISNFLNFPSYHLVSMATPDEGKWKNVIAEMHEYAKDALVLRARG